MALQFKGFVTRNGLWEECDSESCYEAGPERDTLNEALQDAIDAAQSHIVRVREQVDGPPEPMTEHALSIHIEVYGCPEVVEFNRRNMDEVKKWRK